MNDFKQLSPKRDINRLVELKDFLKYSYVGTLSTINDMRFVQSCLIYFAYSKNNLLYKSRTSSNHSRALNSYSHCSYTVYSHDSDYSKKYGVQMIGTSKQILNFNAMEDAVKAYDNKFNGAREKLPKDLRELCKVDVKSTFYEFIPIKFKIIDEGYDGNRTMLEYKSVS